MIKRALLSVSDKTGLVEFAGQLADMGVELVSTGGTYNLLAENNISVRTVESVTGFPEMLDGRVKTLHPFIHGGILARRDLAEHIATIEEHGIVPIDLVVCNLYPFAKAVENPEVSLADAIENIDIGGPSMVRSAAKNHAAVAIVVDPNEYGAIVQLLQNDGEIPLAYRQRLALAAFRHTAHYDAMIADYLASKYSQQAEVFPPSLTLTFEKVQDLRYGENPHQQAAFYQQARQLGPSLAQGTKLQGKELSFCNINDADAALALVNEFAQPAAVAVKHTNPCGVAIGTDILTAYTRAHDADPVSIFGGIVALNREVDEVTAKKLSETFLDIIIAPGFSPEALTILGRKKNLRLLAVPGISQPLGENTIDYRRVAGGLLVQTVDNIAPEQESWVSLTEQTATDEQLTDLHFAWKVAKHAKSNAIVVAKDGVTLGIGMGQVNRIDAARHALERAGSAAQGAVLASDGLFPFKDVVEAASAARIAAIAQPGGSVRDDESIAAANAAGIAMLATGHRHFRH